MIELDEATSDSPEAPRPGLELDWAWVHIRYEALHMPPPASTGVERFAVLARVIDTGKECRKYKPGDLVLVPFHAHAMVLELGVLDWIISEYEIFGQYWP